MYSFEGHSPHEASEVIAVELNLNADEKKDVFRVLDETDEDPIMVIRLNQNWINTFGLAAANQVLDAIATFHISQGQRRDEQATHLCFRFAEGSHINACVISCSTMLPIKMLLLLVLLCSLIWPLSTLIIQEIVNRWAFAFRLIRSEFSLMTFRQYLFSICDLIKFDIFLICFNC